MGTGLRDDERGELEARLRILLPETYQLFDDDIRPISMGSAGLKFGADGKVLWHEMWASFCDLAMAGGPPHRGTLLQPCSGDRTAMETAAYQEASAESCRGIGLVTGLCAEPSPDVGWIRMYCTSAAMCGWLMRAIVMENVSAIGRGLVLALPTGPEFRVHKEIKNVITAVAKTCHYWQDHMSEAKHEAIASLLATMQRERPLIYPGFNQEVRPEALKTVTESMAVAIAQGTGLAISERQDRGWLGVDCREVHAAIWMMRALVASNMLSRREGTVVFVPVRAADESAGERTVHAVIQAHRMALSYQIFV